MAEKATVGPGVTLAMRQTLWYIQTDSMAYKGRRASLAPFGVLSLVSGINSLYLFINLILVPVPQLSTHLFLHLSLLPLLFHHSAHP